MLIQFKCANHRSIKEEVTFSFAATPDSANKETLISFNDSQYLRCAEIYGANGSGKTSLLDAIQKMQAIVLNSNNHQPGDFIIRAPHKLAQNEPTIFSIIFTRNETKYSYGFSYVNNEITDEYLYYWPGRKKAQVFERKNNSVFEFAENFKKEGENCRGRLKNNKLLLSCAANETNIKEISESFFFFKEDLIAYPGEPNNWFEYSIKQLKDDINIKNDFILFMKSIGSDIKDIQVKFEQRPMTKKDLPPFLFDGFPIAMQQQILSQPVNDIAVKLLYEKFALNVNEESAGVQKLFRFICPLIDILHNGKVFICDEIETHLHPSIVAEIVTRFCNNRKSAAQILLTTHDTDLIDLPCIRRDEIWFTELKNDTRATDLYSLTEMKNVRKLENRKKGYITGRYGAIPMLNSNFSEGNK